MSSAHGSAWVALGALCEATKVPTQSIKNLVQEALDKSGAAMRSKPICHEGTVETR